MEEPNGRLLCSASQVWKKAAQIYLAGRWSFFHLQRIAYDSEYDTLSCACAEISPENF